MNLLDMRNIREYNITKKKSESQKHLWDYRNARYILPPKILFNRKLLMDIFFSKALSSGELNG